MTKSKGGRPPLPDHARRRHLIVVRVSDRDRELLQPLADASRVSLPVYLREHALLQARTGLRHNSGPEDQWPSCGDVWHEYAYTMDEPDESAAAIPATCPSCGHSAPHVRKRDKGEYEVAVSVAGSVRSR